MLDVRWPPKRRAAIFAGTQKYAEEQGWLSIIDEFTDETFLSHRQPPSTYGRLIARANHALMKGARRPQVPAVNAWVSSPVT